LFVTFTVIVSYSHPGLMFTVLRPSKMSGCYKTATV
jgi:hypothetical protein